MYATFEVSVAGQHGGDFPVVLPNIRRNLIRQSARAAATCHAAVSCYMKSKLFQWGHQARTFEIVANRP